MVHKRLAKQHEGNVKEQEKKIQDLEKQLKALELEQKAQGLQDKVNQKRFLTKHKSIREGLSGFRQGVKDSATFFKKDVVPEFKKALKSK